VAPELQARDSGDAARLFRNHALGGATIPEHWFGGGGDTNRATAGEMGEPPFKIFSMRQGTWKYILQSVGRYVLRQRLLAVEGAEPDWEDERLDVDAVFPELTSRDTTKYAAALQQAVVAVSLAVDKGLITEETAVAVVASIAGRLGVEVDPVAELAAAKSASADKKAADVFPPAPVVPA